MRHPVVAQLPELVETKITLAGERKQFRCRRLRMDGGRGALVVLFISDVDYRVHDLTLPAGTVTFGHFWSSRPYNVYHWLTPTGSTVAHYANLASDTRLGPDALEWRDLTIDVLLKPNAAPVVLDEKELPPDLDAATAKAIVEAQALFLADSRRVVAELETEADELWWDVFARRRR